MTYDVWMRNYPQTDVNVTEAWELMPFTNIGRAKAFIADIEKMYAAEEWRGHKLYKAKFYAEENRREI